MDLSRRDCQEVEEQEQTAELRAGWSSPEERGGAEGQHPVSNHTPVS